MPRSTVLTQQTLPAGTYTMQSVFIPTGVTLYKVVMDRFAWTEVKSSRITTLNTKYDSTADAGIDWQQLRTKKNSQNLSVAEEIKYIGYTDEKRELTQLKEIISCKVYLSPDNQKPWVMVVGGATHGGNLLNSQGDPIIDFKVGNEVSDHNGFWLRAELTLSQTLDTAVHVDYN